LAVPVDEDAELALEALELDSGFLESSFFVSDELFDSLVDELAAGASLELAATVLDDLASERASLR
jgi:hypothetical protein